MSGSLRVVLQVLAVGKGSFVNPILGTVSKPSAGGMSAPVAKTKMSSNFVWASPPGIESREKLMHNGM